jgi:hypothetical protein
MMKKSIINISLIVTFLFSFPLISIPNQNQDVKLKVRIFQVPRIQSITWNVPAPEGGVKGMTVGGDVTVTFPDGIVLLETDMDKNDIELFKVIKEKVKFSCPDVVGILPIKSLIFDINRESMEVSLVKEELYPQKPLKTDYSFNISPVSIGSEEIVLKLEFITQDKRSPANKEDEGRTKRKLLEHTLGIKYARILLVGFPSNDNGARGTVYWLALSIEN